MIVQMFAQFNGDSSVDPITGELVSPISDRMTTDYSFSLGMYPLITFWNPYDVDMVIPSEGMTLEISMNGYYIGEHVPGAGWLSPTSYASQVALHDDYKKIDGHGNGSQEGRAARFFIEGGTVIGAGRAINFTPPVDSFYDTQNADNNVLVPGATGKVIRGFYTTLRNSNASFNMYTEENFADGGGITGEDYVNAYMTTHNSPSALFVQLYQGDETDQEYRLLHISADQLSFANPNLAPNYRHKVISLEDYSDNVSDHSFAGFVQPIGSSKNESSVDEDALMHIDKILELSDLLTATHFVMSFPETEIISVDDNDFTSSGRVHLLNQMNVRSPLIIDQAHVRAGQNLYRLYTKMGSDLDTDVAVTRLFTEGTSELDLTSSKIGMSNGASGNDQMVLFEAPRESRPVLGIGQLMHANLINVDWVGNTLSDDNQKRETNLQQPHTTPSYAIGNSFASIHLPLGETKMRVEQGSDMFGATPSEWVGGSEGAHYDYSYELNDALWDGFFFSSLLPDNLSDPEFPLPNARMKKSKLSVPTSDLTNERRAAANLLLEGGFNVNSTSVAAWESILGALRDIETVNQLPLTSEQRHNYARIVEPLLSSTSVVPNWGSTDEIVAGYRSLSDLQISRLSEEIVKEIKRRSSVWGEPFLSLSQFVNRSIDPADVSASGARQRFAYTGPLQFAIDQSAINGEPALDEVWDVDGNTSGLWANPNLLTDQSRISDPGLFRDDSFNVVKKRNYLEGAPGTLTQADVLSKIGAILTPRSDTFTIRSYGSSMNQLTGEEHASAYYEMVVQRVPSYVDPSDEDYDQATTTENQLFGRQFKIVSSRWVMGDEI